MPRPILVFSFTSRVKQIQNELGTQILADFEEALSVKGVKVNLPCISFMFSD